MHNIINIYLEYADFFQELPKIWKEYLLKLQSKDRKKALLILEKIFLNDSLEIATYVLQGLIVNVNHICKKK